MLILFLPVDSVFPVFPRVRSPHSYSIRHRLVGRKLEMMTERESNEIYGKKVEMMETCQKKKLKRFKCLRVKTKVRYQHVKAVVNVINVNMYLFYGH